MIDVSCAVIRNENHEILVVQRGENTDHPFKWEFPGGKLNKGETAEDSVIREVAEELAMKIIIVATLQPVEHDYGSKQVRLFPFICDTLMDKPQLVEHIAFQWVNPSGLMSTDFSEADIAVALQYIDEVKAECIPDESVMPASPGERSAAPPVTDNELITMVTSFGGAREAGWLAASAAANEVLFNKLIEFTEADDPRLVFRASWILTKVCETNPVLFIPRLPELIGMLMRTGNGSAGRSLLKILQLTGTSSLDERLTGLLADHCFSLLRSPESAIAVKVYSMDVLVDIVHRFPDLTNELVAVLGLMPVDLPAGIVAKRRAVLRKLSG